ncbi:MAG: GNAT family N-acetyltransferase [Pseudomonadota bacterium]
MFFSGKKSIPPLIETARKSDLSDLAAIHAESFRRGWSDGEFSRLLGRETHTCLVARSDGKAGSPALAFVLYSIVAGEAEIITIATGKRHRGKGLARKLMDATLRRLREAGAVALFLEVDETNKPAIALYKSLGFLQVAERKAYYGGDAASGQQPASALVMRLELG